MHEQPRAADETTGVIVCLRHRFAGGMRRKTVALLRVALGDPSFLE